MDTKEMRSTRHQSIDSKPLALFFILVLTGSLLVMFCINRLNCYLEFESGSKTGILLLPTIPLTFFAGIAATFVAVLGSACLAGLKKTLGTTLLVCAVAVVMAVGVSLFSPVIGTDMYGSFLDGFKDRASSSGVESNAVNWAKQIFANSSLDTNKLDEIHFSGKQVPSFFNSLFDASPEVIVYYGNDKTNAEQIEVRRSSGVDWGLLLVRNTNSLSGWQLDQKPRYCGDGLYVYVYFYK